MKIIINTHVQVVQIYDSETANQIVNKYSKMRLVKKLFCGTINEEVCQSTSEKLIRMKLRAFESEFQPFTQPPEVMMTLSYSAVHARACTLTLF